MRLLDVLAVLGRDSGLDELALCSAAGRAALPDLISECESARLIATSTSGDVLTIGFAHPLVGQVLYKRMLSGERLQLHHQIAEALEHAWSADSAPHAAELARHFVAAAVTGDSASAARYSELAGDYASRLLAFEDAARHYSAALDLMARQPNAEIERRCGLLLSLGAARTRSGDVEGGRANYLQAASFARTAQLPQVIARAALGIGGFRGTPGVADHELMELIEEALSGLGQHEPALRPLLLARLATDVFYAGESERAAQLSSEAVRLARLTGAPETLAWALAGRHYTLHGPQDTEARLAAATELVRLAESSGSVEIAMQGHYLRLFDVLQLGDIDAVELEVEAHERMAEQLKQPFYRWRSRMERATLAILRGELDNAERLVVEALTMAAEIQIPTAAPAGAAQLLLVRREQGRLRELIADVAGLVERYRAVPAWRAALAWVHSQAGNPVPARAELTSLGRQDFHDFPQDESWLSALACLAETCFSLSASQEAAPLYSALLPYSGCTVVVAGGVGCMGAVDRYLGLLASVMGETARAEDHFEAALALHERMRSPPLIARSEVDLARLLLARATQADFDKARQLLAQAEQAADRLGMVRASGTDQARFRAGRAHRPAVDATLTGSLPVKWTCWR